VIVLALFIVALVCVVVLVSMFHEFGHWTVLVKHLGPENIIFNLTSVDSDHEDSEDFARGYVPIRNNVLRAGFLASLPMAVLGFMLLYVAVCYNGGSFSFEWLLNAGLIGLGFAFLNSSCDFESIGNLKDPDTVQELIDDLEIELDDLVAIKVVMERQGVV